MKCEELGFPASSHLQWRALIRPCAENVHIMHYLKTICLNNTSKYSTRHFNGPKYQSIGDRVYSALKDKISNTWNPSQEDWSYL